MIFPRHLSNNLVRNPANIFEIWTIFLIKSCKKIEYSLLSVIQDSQDVKMSVTIVSRQFHIFDFGLFRVGYAKLKLVIFVCPFSIEQAKVKNLNLRIENFFEIV